MVGEWIFQSQETICDKNTYLKRPSCAHVHNESRIQAAKPTAGRAAVFWIWCPMHRQVFKTSLSPCVDNARAAERLTAWRYNKNISLTYIHRRQWNSTGLGIFETVEQTMTPFPTIRDIRRWHQSVIVGSWRCNIHRLLSLWLLSDLLAMICRWRQQHGRSSRRRNFLLLNSHTTAG